MNIDDKADEKNNRKVDEINFNIKYFQAIRPYIDKMLWYKSSTFDEDVIVSPT